MSCVCDGCTMKGAVFETHSQYMNPLGNKNTISMCVQVSFIQAVSAPFFMGMLESMYPIVTSMLDEICEAAKQEMKEKKENELGLWKCAVTTADGTWQTRGWHS